MRRQTASVIRMGTWTVSSSNAEWRVASKHAAVVVVAEANVVVLVIAAMTKIKYVLCSVLADDNTLSTEILEFIAEHIHTTGSQGVKRTFERVSRTFVKDAYVSSCAHLLRPSLYCTTVYLVCFITAEKGGVARANGEGEKEKECTTEGKSRRRREENTCFITAEKGGVAKAKG